MLSLSVFSIASVGASSDDYSVLLSDQIEFRKEFGLDTSLPKLKKLNTIEKGSQANEFQVPLIDEELKELKERFIIQTEEVPKVKGYLEKKYKADSFSIYIDQSAGGEIVVKFKEGKFLPTDHSFINNELKKVSTKLNYRIENTKYTEQELDQFSSELWSKIDEFSVKFDTTSVDVINETLIIGLEDYTEENVAKLQQELKGYPVNFIQVAKPTDSRSPYGGERLTMSSGGTCSAGYYAMSGTSRYLVTAGHCSRDFDDTTGNPIYYYNDVYNYGAFRVGVINKIRYGGSADAASVTTDAVNANSYININGAIRKMTSSQARYGDTVGQAVCVTGQYSSNCGTLQSKNVSYTVDGSYFSNIRGSSASVISGDSGGTVYNSFQYLGVVKGYAGSYKLTYSQIGEVNYHLGLSTYLQ